MSDISFGRDLSLPDMIPSEQRLLIYQGPFEVLVGQKGIVLRLAAHSPILWHCAGMCALWVPGIIAVAAGVSQGMDPKLICLIGGVYFVFAACCMTAGMLIRKHQARWRQMQPPLLTIGRDKMEAHLIDGRSIKIKSMQSVVLQRCSVNMLRSSGSSTYYLSALFIKIYTYKEGSPRYLPAVGSFHSWLAIPRAGKDLASGLGIPFLASRSKSRQVDVEEFIGRLSGDVPSPICQVTRAL